MAGLIMKYFVLKPKGVGPHAEACRCALYAYAQSIEPENPELSRDLFDWWDSERKAALVEDLRLVEGSKKGGVDL